MDVVLADSPVGYWRLNETSGTKANDIAPGFEPPFRDGTYTGGIKLGVDGPTLLTDGGKAASFDGVDDYVVIPPNPLFNQLKNNFTVEAWIKPTALGGVQSILDTRLLVGDAGGWGLHTIGNSIHFNSWGIEGNGGQTSSVLTNGFWQHIVVVFDSKNATNFFFNGIFVTSFPGIAPANTNGQPLYIGRVAETFSDLAWFRGAMGEVAIYNRALTAAEIQEHFIRAFVPEPSSIVMGALGAAAIGFVGFRRRCARSMRPAR
ncbi:MAG: LamG domain-containing protein [Pirellulales bacterium]|nr:LamG domain-containing protein [Pirellulales bacterium]